MNTVWRISLLQFIFTLQVVLLSPTAQATTPLLVDTDQGWPPYLQLDEKGNPTGFAVDLLKAVAKEEHLKLQWQVSAWDQSIKSLARGEIDIVPIMAHSNEREKKFDFSNPILTSYDSIFVRRETTGIENLRDLKHSRILVVNEGLAHHHLRESKQFHRLLLASTSEEAMKRLAAGEADCLLMSRVPGLLLIRQLGLDDVEALPLKVDFYTRIFSLAVTEGNAALINTLNRGIDKVRKNGVYDQLFDYWIASADRTEIQHRKNLEILYLILSGCVLTLIAGALILRVLRRMVDDRTQSLQSEIKVRKKAETSALVNANKFRSAFQSTMQGMILCDLDGQILHANQACSEMTGYTQKELIGLKGYRLFPLESLEAYNKRLALIQKKIIIQMDDEFKIQHKNGSLVWIRIFASVIHSANGDPHEVVFQIQDISQRKEDEQKISQQLYDLSFMRHTLDQHAIVTRINRHQIIETVNQRACDISGQKIDNLIGLPADEFLFDTTDKKLYSSMWSSLEEGEIWQGETTREFRPGFRAWLNTTIVPHMDENDHADFFLAVSSDITQQKLVEAEKGKLKDRLQQAEKMESIGRLTGGIAHDFNNILASILGFTDLTLSKYRGELNNKAINYLEEVYSAGERARDLIGKMMDFSRTNSGESKRIDFTQEVKKALTMLQPTLPSSIQLNTSFPTKDNLTTMIDPIQVHQVVMNLVINARDAISAKGEIFVRVDRTNVADVICTSCAESLNGEYIELSVKDTGYGVSESSLEKIFDPFYTTKDIGKGTGMGLSVIHGIMHEHGGHIQVNTNDHSGSEFKIFFKPISNSGLTPSKEENSKTVLKTDAKSRILVVDDDIVVGGYLKELFISSGHEVTLFNDSKQAWYAFEKEPDSFDVLITDQTMPDLLGTDLIKNIASIRSSFPAILCTGYAEPDIHKITEGLNVKILKKPVTPKKLLTAVSERIH